MKISLKTVERNFLTTGMTSSYTSAYRTNFQNEFTQASIFRYKRLAEIPCSAVLTPLAVRFLQNWMDLNDE
jgi:hypothetical protein